MCGRGIPKEKEQKLKCVRKRSLHLYSHSCLYFSVPLHSLSHVNLMFACEVHVYR